MVSRRDRRAISFGLMVIATSVLLLRVAPATWRGLAERRRRVTAKTALVASLRHELADSTRQHRPVKSPEAGDSAVPAQLLPAATPIEALAAATSRLDSTAATLEMRLDGITEAPDTMLSGTWRRLTLRVEVSGSLLDLVDLVAAISSSPSPFAVASLSTRVENPGSSNAEPELLRSELLLHAWYEAGDARGR